MPRPKKRIAYLPVQHTDFVVTINDREVPWLARLIGRVLAPIYRWRQRREIERQIRDE